MCHSFDYFVPRQRSRSSRAVREIKATATATCTSSFVSTDDSLSAFVWQSVARARMPRLTSETISKAARAIGVRKVLGIPSDYPGLVQNNLFHQLPLLELSTCPLGPRGIPATEYHHVQIAKLSLLLSRNSDRIFTHHRQEFIQSRCQPGLVIGSAPFLLDHVRRIRTRLCAGPWTSRGCRVDLSGSIRKHDLSIAVHA